MAGQSCQRDCYGIILMIINIVTHVLILLVIGYLLHLCGSKLSVLTVHIGLCTVGYVLLMSEAILVISEENVWSSIVSRRSTNHLHWYLQCLGTSFNIAGIVILFETKENHFRSIHGIVGFSSAVTMCFLTLSGFTALFAVNLNKLIRPVVTKFIHNFLGISCYILGMVAQCYGYQKRWMVKIAGSEMANLCTVFTAFIGFMVIIRPVRSLFGQIKSIVY